MGASESRGQDASLNLAVPKHSSIAGRRILDPGSTRCTCCDSIFIPLVRKKHYCRRCGNIICEKCSLMRSYKQRDGGWLFRICKNCNGKPLIFDQLQPGQPVWRLIMDFAGDLSQHRILQTCRRTQLSYHLSYRWGLWEELFTDQQFLAKGANGAVFRTTLRPGVAREFDTPAARASVAVKVIQKNSIFSLRKWSHIQREMETLRLCRNQHVIELIGVFQSPDAVFIILEFAQGGDLFDWLVARRKPKEAEVRAIAVQLLGTVFLMHERFGVVHRDIKPENILLKNRCRGSEEPHLKFADFGFARRYPVKNPNTQASSATSALLSTVGGSNSNVGGVRMNSGLGGAGGNMGNSNPMGNRIMGSSLSGTGGGGSFDVNNLLLNATPCGTLGFAPPEVIKAYNDRKADPVQHEAAPATAIDTLKKMDIFALGVTLSILLTGQEPFPVTSSRAHMEAVQRGPNFNTRPWQYVSQQAKSLIRRMLAPKAEDRPTGLECLRSDWFEGSGASDFIHRADAAEIEEDVRTFQKSVRSLKNRPDMIYSQNKDGATGVVSKAAAVAAEEAEMDEEEDEEENGGEGKKSNENASAAAASASSSHASQSVNVLSSNNNNNNINDGVSSEISYDANFGATPSSSIKGGILKSGGVTPQSNERPAGNNNNNRTSTGGGGQTANDNTARRVAFSGNPTSTTNNSNVLPPLAPTVTTTQQQQSNSSNMARTGMNIQEHISGEELETTIN